MKLTLSKSIIRPYRSSDAPSLVRHIGSYSVARYMSLVPHPYTAAHADEWLAIATAQHPRTHFAITRDDEVIGGIGLTLADPSRIGVSHHVAEFGYWLGESFWGRGIMTEAAVALAWWGFAQLNLVRIHAKVYAPNTASARVLKKAGFAFEGRMRAAYFKEGQFFDGLLFAKVRQ
jgi:RimJ/RimL family protein N-acetyltransferase